MDINVLTKSRLLQPLIDRLLRKKARIHETPLERFSVRIARTLQEYEDAFSLLHAAYVTLGIESVRTSHLRTTPQHLLPEATVFVAYEDDLLVGTMTVTLDSPAGLPLDQDYPSELATLRTNGARLVEFGSLAVVRRCRSHGVTNLLNIAAFHWSINVLQATDCVIGIHPEAGPWHRALFRFSPLGDVVDHVQLKASVLCMVMHFPDLVAHLKRTLPKKLSDGQTFAFHVEERIPACIKFPTGISSKDLTRWKLPREVFQELFARKTNNLENLDPATRKYLRMQRTDATVEFVAPSSSAGARVKGSLR